MHPARRRSAAVLAALGLAGAATVTGTALAGSAQADGSLQLQYKTTDTGTDMIEPWLTVVNNGSSAVSLSTVAIRYYFTEDGHPYSFACEWAQIGCANLTGSIVAMATPTATADHYLEIDFTGGSLAAGASTGDLQLRLTRTDWGAVNQADDYSFANQSSYAANGDITLSVGGSVVSGTAPGGNPTGAPSASPSTSASSNPTGSPTSSPTSPAAPSGVMFDDFHYTGASDPNLTAHDWTVRTGAGGPGVANTWSANAVTFPADPTAQGGQVMNLAASTDGTSANTTQAEIDTTLQKFLDGTYAARVYFNDAPTTGPNGDHVNETFYAISPDNSLYSEDDFEYLPNGGWGGPAYSMYTTSWYSADAMDRVTTDTQGSLQGWHTLVATVLNGTVTYYIDGTQVFSSTGKYYPREDMTIDFNEWFIDLPITGARTWNEKVNWVYFAGGVAQSTAQVQSAVNAYYGAGTNFTDTVPAS
ncbi:cellulose binding domain-containing protein [Actinospica robiniae]|uniref:cellulose binding domain-containing protein n=1 Tax=Actinospica robiniae TaxID=304901 RepID=UPI000413F201|nr:cellulose binding domain-containing protein [Actinospica robiniae]